MSESRMYTHAEVQAIVQAVGQEVAEKTAVAVQDALTLELTRWAVATYGPGIARDAIAQYIAQTTVFRRIVRDPQGRIEAMVEERVPRDGGAT